MTEAERDSLKAELLERRQRDQSVRQIDFASLTEQEREAAFERMDEVDAENIEWLKGVVDAHGWPTISMVGEEASHGAWLIVQHAVDHPEFQARCLLLMEKAAKRDDINKRNVAYLTDRVRIQNGEPQVYGTQYQAKMLPEGGTARNADGQTIWLVPIVEDAEGVDALRAAVGLGPWAENEQNMARRQNREPASMPRQWDGALPVDHTH